jgi:hypothetical protein
MCNIFAEIILVSYNQLCYFSVFRKLTLNNVNALLVYVKIA